MGDAPAMHGILDCDVAVVGGGPAGIAAATRAAEGGAHVVVLDQGLRPGGQIWRHRDPEHLPRLARSWMERFERSGAHWFPETTVIDGTMACGLAVTQRGQACTVRARAIVLATGARELFVPFPGWTLPNVMGMGGAQALLKGGADVRGRRVVVAGSGPLILPVAAAMARGGATVVAVAEQAPAARVARFGAGLWRHPSKLMLGARYRAGFPATRYRMGVWVARASGGKRVEGATLTDGRRRWMTACDLLCCSYGLVPNTQLAWLLGGAVEDGRVVVDHLQRTRVAALYCAGEPTGVGGELAALAEGEIAGLAASGQEAAAAAGALQRRRNAWQRFAERLATTFAPRDALRTLADDETIICRCEDVRRHRLDAAWTSREAKLYTRTGMGPCQGAVCGPACQLLFGWQPGSVRPPIGAPAVDAWLGSDAPTGHDAVISEWQPQDAP